MSSAETATTLGAIENLLKENIGLNSATIGSATIEHHVHERMNACGIRNMHAYFTHLVSDEQELKELVEAVVIPETWFYRGEQSFEALARIVREDWLRSPDCGGLRILSLPCSTGEEPYSIAMTLLTSGLAPHQFHIDAIDVNSRALAKAKRGFYTKNSFRSSDNLYRDRYFTARDNGYQLSGEIIDSVCFQQGNLLDRNLGHGRGTYNIIFCRNLLIYFDRPTQDRAVDNLEKLLRPTGTLFLGHAESNLLYNRWLSSARFPMSFAFTRVRDDRRKCADAAQEAQAQTERRARPVRIERRKPVAEKPAPRPFADVVPPPEPSLAAPQPDLSEAARLANEGHLVEAARLCDAHIAEIGPSAQAYYLLALVRDAAGNKEQATEYLRKTVYLEPSHHDALIHLSLLLEQQGDPADARKFRQRADRVRHRLDEDRTRLAT